MPNSMANFAGRIYRRAKRLPLLNGPFTRGEDAAATVRFWLHSGRRATMRERLARCRTPDDYFAAATIAFGPHQLRTEMVGLLGRLLARMFHDRRFGEAVLKA